MGVVVGSVAIPGSTGNFSETGLPWQPVAVLFFNQYNPLGTHSMAWGCATSSSDQWSLWTGSATETSPYPGRSHRARTDRCIFNYSPSVYAWDASFVSMDADGFTLNLTTRVDAGTAEGSSIYYMALGGDHIGQAHAGTVVTGGATGTEAVTAPGFRPSALIMGHNGDVAFDAGQLSYLLMGAGVTDGTNQYSSFVLGEPGSTGIANAHIHRTDAVACCFDSVNTFRMELDSFDATGFTVDTVDAWPHDIEFGYLAIDADVAVAGSGVQPDSNTTLQYSTPRLEPEGVFFVWPGVDTPSTTGSTTGPLRPGVGAGTLLEERQSSGIYRANLAAASLFTSDGYQLNSEPLGFWGTGDGIGGSDNLTRASANIDAVAMGSFDLAWTNVADTSDRAFGWLALPGEILSPWTPNLYRRQQL